jgi:hypothetical protein
MRQRPDEPSDDGDATYHHAEGRDYVAYRDKTNDADAYQDEAGDGESDASGLKHVPASLACSPDVSPSRGPIEHRIETKQA